MWCESDLSCVVLVIAMPHLLTTDGKVPPGFKSNNATVLGGGIITTWESNKINLRSICSKLNLDNTRIEERPMWD